MNIKGIVTWIGQVESGRSTKTGNEWSKQPFVVEYIQGQYPKSVLLEAWDRNVVNHLSVGTNVSVDFDIEVREWNGRKYNEFRTWRDGIKILDASQTLQGTQAQQTPQPNIQAQSATVPPTQPAAQPTSGNLPF